MKKISKKISTTFLERIKSSLRLIKVKKFRYVDLSILSIMLSLCFSNPICYASETFGQSENSVITKNESWEIKFFKAWRTENGNYQYGLFIDLDDNWKTYWKHPGNSGFKPDFQILKSKNRTIRFYISFSRFTPPGSKILDFLTSDSDSV